MAKTVKKSAKPVAKKATPKKSTAKPVAKKVAAKPATKKPVAKKVAPKKAAAKPVAKKSAPKPISKKVVSKPSPKKAVAKLAPKKAVAKPIAKKAAPKPAPKKTVVKPAPKKAIVKKAAINPKGGKLTSIGSKDISKKAIDKLGKKAAVKATPKKAAAKPVAKKVAAKPTTKPVAKKEVAKKAAVKPTVKKAVAKKANPKPAAIIKEDKTAKMAERRKKIQEIKNNYETPTHNEEENYDDYRLPIVGRTRFSDAELNEFKTIINKKLAEAREELNFYQDQMKESEMNDDDIKFSGMEDGGHTNDKEHLSAMANRQIKFIQGLDAALIRIANKTYGICRMTGNLIDKKRLMAVPHATLSMEAKVGNKKR